MDSGISRGTAQPTSFDVVPRARCDFHGHDAEECGVQPVLILFVVVVPVHLATLHPCVHVVQIGVDIVLHTEVVVNHSAIPFSWMIKSSLRVPESRCEHLEQ